MNLKSVLFLEVIPFNFFLIFEIEMPKLPKSKHDKVKSHAFFEYPDDR